MKKEWEYFKSDLSAFIRPTDRWPQWLFYPFTLSFFALVILPAYIIALFWTIVRN